jgi:hypothetical protein
VLLYPDPPLLSVSSKRMRCTGNMWRHSDSLRGGWDAEMEVEGWTFRRKGYCSGNALDMWVCSMRYPVRLLTQLLAERLCSFISPSAIGNAIYLSFTAILTSH